MKPLLFTRKWCRTAISVVLLSSVPMLHAFDRPDHVNASVAAALLEYYRNFPVEKVFVQTDRQGYAPGQVIWYKMYAEAYGVPSRVSQVGYVQLVDRKGAVLVTKKLRLVNGGADGDLRLPDSLANVVYQLRGFTTWMLNFGESGIFHKNILVGHSNREGAQAAGPTAGPVAEAGAGSVAEAGAGSRPFTVKFFPEGGDLIGGIKSKVAFLAQDGNDRPVNVTGLVKDDAGQQVGSLTVMHDGMGSFEFIPSTGHRYAAEVRFQDGSTMTISLPDVQPFGVSLHIEEQTPDLITVKIIGHEKNRGDFSHLQLAAFQNSGKVAVYPIELDPGVNLFDLHKKDFGSGILQVAVLDGEMPLAERLVYLQANDQVVASLESDTLSFDPRSKSVFTLHLGGAYGKSDSANLSVSVTDADASRPDETLGDISSSLLATSELEGYVPHPGYYFGGKTTEFQYTLDLLMMTHTWRYFSWKDVFAKEPAVVAHPAERSLYLAGHVRTGGRRPAKSGSPIVLTIRNQDYSVIDRSVVPDTGGNFRVDDLLAYGDCIVAFPSESIPRGGRIEFEHSFVDSMTRAPFYDPADLAEDYHPVAGRAPENVAEGATASRASHDTHTSAYVGYPLYGSRFADYDLSGHTYAASTRLFDFLKGRFPGLEIQGIETNPRFYLDHLQINTASTSSQLEEKANPLDSLNSTPYYYNENVPGNDLPYFYVNEIPVSFTAVKDIPLRDIAFIRYFRPPVKFMPPGTGLLGVIAIYTKSFNDPTAVPENDRDGARAFFSGYSISRKYFQVKYRGNAQKTGGHDLRTTLYWNPTLAAGEDGDFHFSFFNSDRAKRYRIVIDGIDDRGRIIRLDKVVGGN